jgi:hypothetical protein
LAVGVLLLLMKLWAVSRDWVVEMQCTRDITQETDRSSAAATPVEAVHAITAGGECAPLETLEHYVQQMMKLYHSPLLLASWSGPLPYWRGIWLGTTRHCSLPEL